MPKGNYKRKNNRKKPEIKTTLGHGMWGKGRAYSKEVIARQLKGE